VTVAGGKWTTYRRMAEAAVDRAERVGDLARHSCPTRDLPIEGSPPAEGEPLEALVVRAARQEMSRRVEDVLARRSRLLFLDARAAIDAAPRVARLLASELGRDDAWAASESRAFTELARGYQ
jgi:glycerol-3-phosphate dehydrogenase